MWAAASCIVFIIYCRLCDCIDTSIIACLVGVLFQQHKSQTAPFWTAEVDSILQSEEEVHMSNMPPHQCKASNVYGAAGPPHKSPRLWKFAPARGAPAGATTVLPYEAVSAQTFSLPCQLPL